MRKLVQLLSLVAIGGISFELAIRLDDRIRFKMPMWSPVRSQEDLIVRDELGAHGRPNAQWGKWRMNNLGTRGPDLTPTKPPGTIRVVVLGASETYGLYESPGREFPMQLQDSLNRPLGYPCDDTGIEVLNAANPGMSLPTFTEDLRLRLAPLRPDVVVVYPAPVQYLDIRQPQTAPPDSSGRGRLPGTYALYPRGWERLREGVKSMLPAPIATWLRRRAINASIEGRPSSWRFASVPPTRIEAFERDLARLVGTIREIGAVPLLMTHANKFEPGLALDQDLLTMWERFYPRATGPTLLAFDSAGRDATVRVGRDSAALVVDLAASIPAPRSRWFADYVHFTDEGAGFVAGKLAEAVRRLARCRVDAALR